MTALLVSTQGAWSAPLVERAYAVVHKFNDIAGSDGASPSGGLLSGPDGAFYGLSVGGGTRDNGMVFRFGPDHVIEDLHDFNYAVDGWHPIEPPIMSADGHLYGTTQGGGANYGGTIFRMAYDGSDFEVLYSFTWDGTYDTLLYPANLALGKDGTLYGTAAYGPSGYGAVFSLSPAGTFQVLHTFAADGSEGEFGSSLIVAPDGSLWGSTEEGGSQGNGTIWHIDGNLMFSVVHQMQYQDGESPMLALETADGSFFGVALGGGAYGGGTVFKITAQGAVHVIHAMGANPSEGVLPISLMRTADGLLHGTTLYGGKNGGDGTVFRLKTNGELTTMHDFGAIFAKGTYPSGGALHLGADGMLYGMAAGGGLANAEYPDGMGVLYSVAP